MAGAHGAVAKGDPNSRTERDIPALAAGDHHFGNGLYLVVQASGAKSWLGYIFFGGKRREIGHGAFLPGLHAHVSLAAARLAQELAKSKAKEGVDPRQLKLLPPPQPLEPSKPTFRQCVDAYLKERRATWKGRKTVSGWTNTMFNHAAALCEMPVDTITTPDITRVLDPLFLGANAKHETAEKTQKRMEKMLDVAKFNGHREGENPARWAGHLEFRYTREKLKNGHFASLHFEDAPEFLVDLRKRRGEGAAALEFTLLTATRSVEVYEAKWSEIDLKARRWNIPAARCKNEKTMRREGLKFHIIPLSDPAIVILTRQLAICGGKPDPAGWVFPGQVQGKPISSNTMDALLERMERPVTVHGFRSTFRMWAGRQVRRAEDGETVPAYKDAAMEAALGHISGDATERAYNRDNYLVARLPMMKAWAAYMTGGLREQGTV